MCVIDRYLSKKPHYQDKAKPKTPKNKPFGKDIYEGSAGKTMEMFESEGKIFYKKEVVKQRDNKNLTADSRFFQKKVK